MFKRVTIAFLFVLISLPISYRAEISNVEKTKIPVPPSLMLHSHSVNFLPEFLDLIEKEGYTTTTYREFGQMIKSWQFPTKKLIIISIDDYGPYRITATLKTMAEELRKRKMVAVLSLVVTKGIDQDTWDYLKGLEDDGFEIASHTITHDYLPDLSNEALRTEIEGSYQLISDHLSAPTSLVLPYGDYRGDQRIIQIAKEAGYEFVVGISGGETISDTPVFYVGRGSPYLKHPEKTLSELERQFPGWIEFTIEQKIHQHKVNGHLKD